MTLSGKPIISGAADSPSSFEEVSAKLGALATDAVAALHADLLDNSPSTRTRAALAILHLWAEFDQFRDLKKRVSMLERRNWK